MARDMAMIALGATMVLAYQKFQKPIMEKMNCMKQELDDMM